MMKRFCLSMLLLSLVLFYGCCSPEKTGVNLGPGQHSQTFTKSIFRDFTIKYLLFLPEDYGKAAQRWPMILFLHGMGERGDDLEKVKMHGPPKIVQARRDFPFIVVSPQCPEGKWWSNDPYPELLIGMLDEVTARYAVDPDRVYLTGLSMGGYGSWALGCAYPGRFAALAPICGAGEPQKACNLRDVPVWVFHGARDNIVPLKKSEEMVEALQACQGKVKFTVYPDAGHDSWTKTYDNAELYDWFLEQSKNNRP